MPKVELTHFEQAIERVIGGENKVIMDLVLLVEKQIMLSTG